MLRPCVRTYTDAVFGYHGYTRAANGSITTFDAPGAGTGMFQGTAPYAINTAGEITGSVTANFVVSGFVRAAGGAAISFAAPGSANYTVGASINALGEIAGSEYDANYVQHGFLRTP